MGLVYLIRHAQAGPRENYDTLSPLGRRQAELVGDHLAQQGIAITSLYSGTMARQRQTADIVRSALSCEKDGGDGANEDAIESDLRRVEIDPRWDEFSLASVYRAICHRMIEESEQFRRDFAEMQEALKQDPHTTRGATGRCDAAIVRAWMENRYPDYTGESWREFRKRVESCIGDLSARHGEESIAVFTSATPIAIFAGAALGLSDEKLLEILGVIYNTSISVFGIRNGAARLFSFNATPHLNGSLRTYR
jgi:broad specificity phosphatase PhoE